MAIQLQSEMVKHTFGVGESHAGKYLNTMDVIDMTVNSNEAPQLVSLTLSTMPDAFGYRDSVSISCVVSDYDNDLVSLSLEYSTDEGQTWFYIDQGHLNQPTVNLKSFETNNIIWNSTSDLPINESAVYLRITPTDGEKSGSSKLVGPAILNNSGSWLSSISGPKAKSKADFVRRDAGSQFILWGGEDNTREDSNTQEVFNHQNLTWTTEVPIADFVIEARSDHSSVFFGNYIYHWGGRKNNAFINSFTVYDSFSDAWIEDIAISGGTSRASHTANVYDSKMYVWGGEDSTGILNTLEYYNFLSNQWVYVGTGGTPRRGHSSVLYNNKLYFYGGEIEVDSEIELTDTVDIYDLTLGQWTLGLSSGCHWFVIEAVIDGHRMWVWGGSKGSGFTVMICIFMI